MNGSNASTTRTMARMISNVGLMTPSRVATRQAIFSLTTRDDPPGGHRDAVETVGSLHGSLLVRHDDQLGFPPEFGDKIQKTMQVHVIEGSLDLIHHIERRWSALEDREQESERSQRPFATGQQRQLPARSCLMV